MSAAAGPPAAPSALLTGAPELAIDGRLQPLAPERRHQLLAYLAVRNGWVGRDQLAALFWPERSQDAARHNLRKVLTLAQQSAVVGDFERQGDLVRWSVDSDVRRFEQAFAAGDWSVAAAAVRGVLLEGIEAGATAAFGEWLRFERERLAARWREAVTARLAQLEADPSARAALAERALHLEPLDENAQTCLLQALVDLGREAEAARRYKAFAARLLEELGVEPSQGLRLWNQRDRRPPLAVLAPQAAPATTFVGRRAELREAQGLLRDPRCRVLTITGPGGVGKSRLAAAVLAALAGEYPGGTFFVTLDDLAETAQVAPRIAAALAVALADGRDPIDALAARLNGAATLLALDNSEHLEGVAVLFSRLLAACPRLRMLNTSRTRLGIEGEWVLPLAGLPVPEEDEVDADVLLTFDAVRLFEMRALAAAPGFDAARHAAEVATLVRAVEGWPLAIELAAAWVRLLPVADICADLQRSLDLLEAAEGRADRHRSVRASFEHSWRLLAPAERRALAALTVLRGSFTRHAAAHVAGATLPLLAALVDKSLVRADGDGRFSLHLLIAQCAAEKLDAGELNACARRHAEHYGLLLARHADYRRIDQKEALREIGAELENCRAAWRWATRACDAGWIERTALALLFFFESKGRWREGIDLLDEAVTAFDRPSPALRPALALLLRAAATLHYRRGDAAQAEASARRSLKFNRLLRQRSGMKACLNLIGLALWRRDRLAEAIRYFEQGLRLAEEDEDERGIASFTNGIALCEKARGQFDAALPRYEQALAINRRIGDLQGVGNALNNLGNLHRVLRRWQPALRCFEEGLALCDAQGFASMRPFFLVNLALTCFELGELDRCHRLALRARDEAHERGEPYIEAAAHQCLARLAIARGDGPEAIEPLRQAMRIALAEDHQAALAAALNICGEWLLGCGDAEAAVRLWRFVAAHPQLAEVERADARRKLSQHGAAEHERTPAAPNAHALPSFAAVAGDLLARFDAAQDRTGSDAAAIGGKR